MIYKQQLLLWICSQKINMHQIYIIIKSSSLQHFKNIQFLLFLIQMYFI